jgi:hypothetical protein
MTKEEEVKDSSIYCCSRNDHDWILRGEWDWFNIRLTEIIDYVVEGLKWELTFEWSLWSEQINNPTN